MKYLQRQFKASYRQQCDDLGKCTSRKCWGCALVCAGCRKPVTFDDIQGSRPHSRCPHGCGHLFAKHDTICPDCRLKRKRQIRRDIKQGRCPRCKQNHPGPGCPYRHLREGEIRKITGEQANWVWHQLLPRLPVVPPGVHKLPPNMQRVVQQYFEFIALARQLQPIATEQAIQDYLKGDRSPSRTKLNWLILLGASAHQMWNDPRFQQKIQEGQELRRAALSEKIKAGMIRSGNKGGRPRNRSK